MSNMLVFLLLSKRRKSLYLFIRDRFFPKSYGRRDAAETTAGRADRLKRAARSGGWFSVRPAGKRSRQPAAHYTSFLKGIR
ncbi:hypothetical protein L2D08_16110 [Domibacillus sp. PGB-M46]|uniref:hypothetical protein n=1 Tax=Domibacillus sp. PGB-M46 TaxID=2910255 RepID=UPI001F59029B|nr:hypothetical protein [Domibacillus sp. PGB-M46]MCI2255888.1 hypothetical protein [Domibacillus sp. PGB-M46]